MLLYYKVTIVGAVAVTAFLSYFTISCNYFPQICLEIYRAAAANNSPPVLEPIGHKEVSAFQTLRFKASASDSEGDVITYSIRDGPTGASIDPQTGIFTWRAGDKDIHVVRVIAADRFHETEEIAVIHVLRESAKPLWRAQLWIKTGSVEDARTDDDVRVQLNGNNITWLDYPRDDFEKGDSWSYDLNLINVPRMSLIDYLEIAKNGQNGWCIEEIALRLNHNMVFYKSFANLPDGCRWLDNDYEGRRIKISSEDLRTNQHWIPFYVSPFPPATIEKHELTHIFEGIIGDIFHYSDLFWDPNHDGKAVELSKIDDSTIHVTIDSKADIFLFDPYVEIELDVSFSCIDEETGPPFFSIRVENYDYRIDSPYDPIPILGFLDGLFFPEISSDIESINYWIALDLTECPNVMIDDNVNLKPYGDI